MYLPKHFEQNDIESIHALIENYPLATLITGSASGACANHIPLHLEKKPQSRGVLRGHIPRVNPLWQATNAIEGLAIFHGVNAYISPSWYATKADSGKAVPTWNYTAVHAHGRIRFIDDSQWLLTHLKDFSDKLESNLSKPWRVDDAPADFIAGLLKHLIGIEIVIDKLEGKWKVSQNRSPADRDGVIAGLENSGGFNAPQMAELIRAVD